MSSSEQPKGLIILKCWTPSFQALKDGTKRFEYRKDDRPYDVGVTVKQEEWNPDTGYTGDYLYHDITWIIRCGIFGIPEGYCIFSVTEPRIEQSRPHPATAVCADHPYCSGSCSGEVDGTFHCTAVEHDAATARKAREDVLELEKKWREDPHPSRDILNPFREICVQCVKDVGYEQIGCDPSECCADAISTQQQAGDT